MAPAGGPFDNDPRNQCLKSDDSQVPFEDLLSQITKSKVHHVPEPGIRYKPRKQCWQEPVEGFRIASSAGRDFDPAPGFLRPKQFNLWDTERILAPARTYPVRGSAGEMYDHDREGLPPWRPTKWGAQTGECFPLDSVPPLPSKRTPKGTRSNTRTAESRPDSAPDSGVAAAPPKLWEKQRPGSAQAGSATVRRRLGTPATTAASGSRPATSGNSGSRPVTSSSARGSSRRTNAGPQRPQTVDVLFGGAAAPEGAPEFPPRRPKNGQQRRPSGG